MANDSQRDKARAVFGKTFFENSKALPNPKNAAAALQKRANARPIPTYKVGGVVKKQNGGAMSGRNTPEADDVLITTARGKRLLEEQKRREAEKAKADAAKRARADKLLGIPAQKGGGKAGCYADGGKAMAGAKRAMKADEDFTGLMKSAANRAAAKGTPVMKQGGPTDEYTAKRVMSRIKAGNFAEGGAAKDRMEERMRKAEMKYKVALAKGKNEGIAKAKFERRNADIADDYAKKTGADRTSTKAAEQAAKAALREARRTDGASIAKRDMAKSMEQKGAAEIKQFSAGKPLQDVSATLKGLSGIDVMPKAAKAPKAQQKINVRRPLAPAANRNETPAVTPPASASRNVTVDKRFLQPKGEAPLRANKPKAEEKSAPNPYLGGIKQLGGALGSLLSSYPYGSSEKIKAREAEAKAEKAKRDAAAKASFSKATSGKGIMAPVKRAAGGAAKVRKGMMKGK